MAPPKISTSMYIAGLLLFGTTASMLSKIIYYVSGPSLHSANGVPHPDQRFEKPWFQVLTMFIGMAVCIVLDKRNDHDKDKEKAGEGESEALIKGENSHAANGEHSEKEVSLWIMNVPTLFDLFATGCGTTGLLYTSVSVYQMLRAGQLVCTAILSIIFLKRRLDGYNILGICFSCFGIALVGYANIVSQTDETEKANQMFGVFIILCGQVLQASQIVVEEFLLQNLKMSGVKVVAYEGLFGMMHCILWVLPLMYFLPGSDYGRLEDTVDSLYMISHTWKVLFVMCLDMAVMLGYNVAGMGVTQNLSGVARVIIETLRTLLVWLMDLLCWYVITPGFFGEPWTPYSFIQAIGFLLLVCGTLTYNYKQLVAEKSVSPVFEAEVEPLSATETKKVSVPAIAMRPKRYDEEADKEEEISDDHAGTYYTHPVGSAAHASYLGSLKEAGHFANYKESS